MSESRALYYPAGESIVEEVVVKKANGDVVNLTGATSSFKVYKQQSGAAIFEKTVGDGVTLDSPTDGEASVETDPADTADLRPGWYWYEWNFTVSGVVYIALWGQLQLGRVASSPNPQPQPEEGGGESS